MFCQAFFQVFLEKWNKLLIVNKKKVVDFEDKE